MQTYSHYIITAVLNRKLKEREQNAPPSDGDAPATSPMPPVRSGALLLGSIAPDLPLILITILFMLVDLSQGNGINPGSPGPGESRTGYLFRYLFFHDPGVKFAHNLFHAPFLVLFYTGIGYWAWKRGKAWGAALFWFGIACAIHTALDIPLHYDDGPLIFFPFDWQTRFYSPISYWDSARYGVQFAIFEHLFVLGLLIYLLVGWWRNRRPART